jgi:hypothetical protein
MQSYGTAGLADCPLVVVTRTKTAFNVHPVYQTSRP